jgi:hypothetical protein
MQSDNRSPDQRRIAKLDKEVSTVDPPIYPGTDDDTSAAPELVRRTPRWVPVLAIVIAVVVVLAIVALHLAGIVGPGSN